MRPVDVIALLEARGWEQEDRPGCLARFVYRQGPLVLPRVIEFRMPPGSKALPLWTKPMPYSLVLDVMRRARVFGTESRDEKGCTPHRQLDPDEHAFFLTEREISEWMALNLPLKDLKVPPPPASGMCRLIEQRETFEKRETLERHVLAAHEVLARAEQVHAEQNAFAAKHAAA